MLSISSTLHADANFNYRLFEKQWVRVAIYDELQYDLKYTTLYVFSEIAY